MTTRILLAGASGVVGRRLLPLLRDAGHEVFGTTRSPANAERLRALGAEPLVVDVFDAAARSRAVASARPEVVIHQLTDLPDRLDPGQMAEAIPRNARIRDEGTRNLVAATRAAGAAPLHVDAAAYAALLAVERGAAGVYNIAEPNAYASTEKARRELGWRDDFRLQD